MENKLLHHGEDLETIGTRVLSEEGWIMVARWLAMATLTKMNSLLPAPATSRRHAVAALTALLHHVNDHDGPAAIYSHGQLLRRFERLGVLHPDRSYTVKCDARRVD